jgi:hypothetical protein
MMWKIEKKIVKNRKKMEENMKERQFKYSLFNLLFFHIFHIISQFSSLFSIIFHYSVFFISFHYILNGEMMWKIEKKIVKNRKKMQEKSEMIWKI